MSASTPSTPTVALSNSTFGSPSTPTTPGGAQQRLILKQMAIDTWTLKEQLGLASAVLRSGDQNWVSVSRQMKPFSEDGRPQDWFSQKNCAQQYNMLLGKVDTPRRKRGEKAVESETPGEAIVKKLTAERIKELRKVIEQEQSELLQLEEECRLLNDESVNEEKLQEIESEIEKEEKDEAEKKAAHEKWLMEREEKKQAIQAALKAHTSKLPLKGAAAAAVQQAGAARRASTQSERSSFSDIDSPLPVSQSSANATTTQEITESPVKKEDETEIVDTQDQSISMPTSPIKSPAAQNIQDSAADAEAPVTPSKVEEEETTKEEPEKIDEPVEKEEVKPADEEPEASEETTPDKEPETPSEIEMKPEEAEESNMEVDQAQETPSTSEETTPTPTNDQPKVEVDEEDDEIIIKKEVDTTEETDNKKTKPNIQRPPPRSKKVSEVSEPDEDITDDSRKVRETRSKKISERSEGDTEESPGPPASTSRATRRSRKIDTSNEGSTERDEATAVENKRLSRVKESEGVGRGRRGSGATNNSRSSSPVGSGDESEADQTPLRGSRSRKKSGIRNPEVDSAPVSPAPSSVDVTEDSGVDEWQKGAINVINEIKGHKFADRVFAVLNQPSSQDADVKPITLRHIDLTSIRKNIDNSSIKTNTDLHHALHHLFLNLIMSLGSDAEEYEMAFTMYRDCMSHLDEARLLSLGSKSPGNKKGKEKKDDEKRKRSLEDTPVTSSKRRKR